VNYSENNRDLVLIKHCCFLFQLSKDNSSFSGYYELIKPGISQFYLENNHLCMCVSCQHVCAYIVCIPVVIITLNFIVCIVDSGT